MDKKQLLLAALCLSSQITFAGPIRNIVTHTAALVAGAGLAERYNDQIKKHFNHASYSLETACDELKSFYAKYKESLLSKKKLADLRKDIVTLQKRVDELENTQKPTTKS